MLLESLRHDLRYAARSLRNSPVFTLVSVTTLALAIGGNAAAFSLINAWLIRPLPLKNPQQIVSVWRTERARPREPQFFNLWHDYVAWAAQSRSFQQLAATVDVDYELTGSGEAEEIHGAVATWNLFEVAGVRAEAGRLFQPSDANGEPTCVIAHALWLSRFKGSADAIGRSIELNGKLYRVVGVLPASFSLRVLDRPFDNQVWAVISTDDPTYAPVSPSPVAVIGRLNAAVTARQAEAEITAIQRSLDQHPFPDHYVDAGVLVVKLQQDNARTVRTSLLLLFAAVSVLLLIACVNVGSLILGRAQHRQREFAVRVALGCGAKRLLQQIAAEVVTLFAISGIAGLALAAMALRIFATVNPFGVLPPGGVSLDWRVLIAASAIVMLAALVLGSLPAYRAVKFAQGEALRAGATTTSTRRNLRARAALVTVQFALSLLLLVAAGLLISTFIKINSQPLGYSTDHAFVAELSLPNRNYPDVAKQTRFAEQLLIHLRSKPAVAAAGIATSWPFQLNGLNPIEIGEPSDNPTSQLPQAAWLTVSGGYFDALAIPLLRGRSFSGSDTTGFPFVAIINQQMARQYFAGRNPIGERLRIRYIDDTPTSPRNPWVTVVGIVGDTRSQRYNALEWDRYPAIYTALAQREQPKRRYLSGTTSFYVYVRGSDALNRSTLVASVDEVDANVPVGSFRATGEIAATLTAQPRIRAAMFGAFGVLALLLAAIGIYGLMAQNVEQRRREIGIRMALGALREDIVRLIVRRALALVTVGLLCGLIASVALSRMLKSFVYGVWTLNLAIYLAALATLMAVALLASYLPARRASSVDPVVVLRAE